MSCALASDAGDLVEADAGLGDVERDCAWFWATPSAEIAEASSVMPRNRISPWYGRFPLAVNAFAAWRFPIGYPANGQCAQASPIRRGPAWARRRPSWVVRASATLRGLPSRGR